MRVEQPVVESGTPRWLQPFFCTVVGMAGNIALTVGKLVVGFLGQSAALVADGFHSLSDVASDIGVLLALKASRRPPDRNHPYGHHSFETLGAVLVSLAMIVTAVLIGRDAIMRFLHRDYLTPDLSALIMAVVAVVMKELMARYTLRAGRLHNSPALLSNGLMHRSDAISSLAAAGGILGAMLGVPSLDTIGAMIIALFILKMGGELLLENVLTLTDTMPGDDIVDDMRRVAEAVPGVQQVRDIKVRQRGSWYLADLRVAVPPDETIVAAHEIAHEVEQAIRETLAHVDRVFVHVEPGD